MKPRKERSNRLRAMRLWEWNEVVKAAPYLHSVIGSLREHWLEVLATQRQLDRLPSSLTKRDRLIEENSSKDERDRAQVKFDDALAELNGIDVFLVDPVQGIALIPFRKEDDLAWYVFDHFAAEGVVGWRYHHDPIEERRPLEGAEKLAVKGAISVTSEPGA